MLSCQVCPVMLIYAQTDTLARPHGAKDSIRVLQKVSVTGMISSRQLQQQPVNVSSIDTRPFYNTNVTGLRLLQQMPGIKVKQEGGFGSKVDFLINGSTGKQVKFFIDGLPQDNLGETQSLSVLPVEQMERIEVYKGILPVELSADALGGAINIVTRRELQGYLDASYAVGSFNTHRFNLLGKRYFSEHFFAGIQSGFNYSDNNYKITANVPDSFGNPHVKEVRRFHDQFKNYTVKADAGWVNTRWADQFVISFTSAGLHRQLQNNVLMTQPYGQASYKEDLLSGILKYQKVNLLKNLNLTAFASFNRLHGLFTDTSKNVYNWEGIVVARKLSGGEIISSGNELHLYTHVYNAKLTAAYALNDHYRIILSSTLQRYLRTGEDSVAKNYYGGIDFYSNPSALTKNITGIGFDGRVNARLRITAAAKYLFAHLKGYTFEWTSLFPVVQSMQDVSYNSAVAYRLTNHVLLKASYEHAIRLPEPEEAFGDLMLVKANPGIRPEKSDNINANFLFDSDKFHAELTGFYRNVSNIIYLRPALTSATYQNLLKARVKGIEGAVRYRMFSFLSLNGNFTFQDMRNRSVIDGGGINNDRYKNARLPNIPYLFANGGIMYTTAVLKKHATLQVWWNTNYTHEYFLYWEIDGARDLKNRIPEQLTHYAGLSCALTTGLSFTFEVNNLTNQVTYDNFKAQLPGRAYSLKLRMYLSKSYKNSQNEK